jgi:speckle-type POZ protein
MSQPRWTFQIGGVSISAHKSILMAHSPIFHAMFTHKEAEEFQSGTVKITDFEEPEPMRAVVRYCYLGCLDAAAMEDNCAVEIFKLADRYCIKGLKSILERHFLEKRLSKENVIALAVLADAHSAPKLKEVGRSESF